jgi:hypothetical protein
LVEAFLRLLAAAFAAMPISCNKLFIEYPPLLVFSHKIGSYFFSSQYIE